MFSDFIKRLTEPEPEASPRDDARLAMAALMVRLAKADGDYADDEIARIDRILARKFSLSPFEATAMRRDAEVLEGQAPDTVRFTRAIKDHVPLEERDAVMEAFWEIALVDGIRDHEENALLRLVANLLGINDRDSALARQRVEASQS